MKLAAFQYDQLFQLEAGGQLPGIQIAYHTYGELNADRDNVVWVCHALTANSEVADWWPGMVGDDCLLDPRRDFIICANMLGSCYGSTYALSINPDTNTPYFHDFPEVTVQDMVRGQRLLAAELGIRKIKMVIGGSMGGQQVLEWACQAPELVECAVPIATNARHSPWGIAFNESQRMAIEADQTWKEENERAGLAGMRAARAVALLSYRNYDTYLQTQADPESEKREGFRAISYQRYQGEKLERRFDAFAYWALSKAMDSHNIGRGRGGLEKALAGIEARVLTIGVDSDLLFPIAEQELIARHTPGARFASVGSRYGHDGFLIEVEALTREISTFLGQ